ncbi:MAG: hypothetical protein R3D59_09055 [Paracoccaceae bacterium]
MADLLKPLGLAALLALASPALAQDTGGDAAPAADDATAAPAADAAPADGQPQAYIDEVFNDWSRECVRRSRRAAKATTCAGHPVPGWDDNGRPSASSRSAACRRAAVRSPRPTWRCRWSLSPTCPPASPWRRLGLGREYQYLFCLPVTGWLPVQPNLSAADIEAFKAGTVLNMGFAIVAKLTEPPSTRRSRPGGLHRGLGQQEGAGSTGGAAGRAAPYREKMNCRPGRPGGGFRFRSRRCGRSPGGAMVAPARRYGAWSAPASC